MPRTLDPLGKTHTLSFEQLFKLVNDTMVGMSPLKSQCNRPLKMSFEDHLRALVFFHLEEHKSAQHLLQVLEEDDFARNEIAPKEGIKKSSFSEATNSRGLEQFMHVFKNLQTKAAKTLPKHHPDLGNLVGIDRSLINATLSMYWADYRKGAKKAKIHIGFDLNRSIPRKILLTDGNWAERPFVSQILSPGETGIMDRGYQCHEKFDLWQKENKLFMCRIKASTRKTIIKANHVEHDSIIFGN
jgi:DDE family transposase